jgi:hypothetical protein
VQNEQNSEIILTDIENYTNNSNLFTYFTNPHALGLLSLVYNNLAFACEPQQISPNYIRNKVATTIAERKII